MSQRIKRIAINGNGNCDSQRRRPAEVVYFSFVFVYIMLCKMYKVNTLLSFVSYTWPEKGLSSSSLSLSLARSDT